MKNTHRVLLSLVILLTLMTTHLASGSNSNSNTSHILVTQFDWHKTSKGSHLTHMQTATFTTDGGTVTCQKTVTQGNPCSGWGNNNMYNVEITTAWAAYDLLYTCNDNPCVSATWQTTNPPNNFEMQGVDYTLQNATMMPCLYAGPCAPLVSWSGSESKTVDIDFIPSNSYVSIITHFYYLSSDSKIMDREDMTMLVQKGYG